MDIKTGKVFVNKTKRYLLYTLIDYGEEFERRFTKLFKLAVGIGDFALVDMGLILKESIYILVDTKQSKIGFNFFLEWFKKSTIF